MSASTEIEIFAVNDEPLENDVELTVTPPLFVVPVTWNAAFAPLLKPFPLIVTSRLVVPWAADDGSAPVTVICATHVKVIAANAKNTNNRIARLMTCSCLPARLNSPLLDLHGSALLVSAKIFLFDSRFLLVQKAPNKRGGCSGLRQ